MNNTTSLTKMQRELVAVTEERDRLAAELQKLREQLFGADGWEVNARYVLDRCKHTVRMCEGGGPENLIGSLILTFTKMEGMLDGTVAAPAVPASGGKHPSHTTRSSDSSLYDEKCVNCGATDVAGGGWGELAKPCKAAPAPSVPNNEFVQHLKKCKQDVESWPEWKKRAAGIAPAATTTLSDDKLISLIYKHLGTEEPPRIVYESGPLYVTKLTYGMRALADAIIAEASIQQATPSVPEEWREKLSEIALHCTDSDTTDAIDVLLQSAPQATAISVRLINALREMKARAYKQLDHGKGRAIFIDSNIAIDIADALLQSAEGHCSQTHNEVRHD